MKVLNWMLALVLLAACASAGAGVGAAQEESPEPNGNLAEVMRGILFPNSNILFDVQTQDPEAIGAAEDGTSVSATFSGIYKGWQMVQQAAIALAEAEKLITVPGRLCENGKPVPVDQEDFVQWAKALTEAGKATYKAAKDKNREAVSELTNMVAGACEDCHTKYRRYEDRCRQ